MAILRNARIPALVLVARVVVELYNDATLAAVIRAGGDHESWLDSCFAEFPADRGADDGRSDLPRTDLAAGPARVAS